jgi:hypothetical protein
MAFAGWRNPAFRQHLSGKDLTFELFTLDDKVARHFVVKDQRVRSRSGRASDAAFGLAFKDATSALETLTAANKQLAFMQGIQSRELQVKGNPLLLIWFQGLIKHLFARKSAKSTKAA